MTFEELIEYARKEGCSDVHITVGTAIALRKFGKLEMLEPIPQPYESENMILEHLTEEQKSRVIGGEDLDFAMIMPNRIRLRANIYHQRNHLAATYRILQETIPTFDELGIPEAIRKLADEPRGLVLITGPTGSGKSTTMASMVDYINKTQSKHIITIEDPIEYVYPYAKSMIHQREVGRDVAEFSIALRSALREDPDIILVGEMRDYETISAAVTAAETGHLVLATLHTTSAPQTVDRILDAYPPYAQSQARIQLASVLKGICTQVLIPKYDGNGMVMATEVLLNSDAVANQIRENKNHQITTSMQAGMAQGMHTLNWDIRRLERSQIITRENALKFCSSKKDYENER